LKSDPPSNQNFPALSSGIVYTAAFVEIIPPADRPGPERSVIPLDAGEASTAIGISMVTTFSVTES